MTDNWYTTFMEDSVGIPDALFREVRAHATRDGLELHDAVVQLLRRGLLAMDDDEPKAGPILGKDPITGFPVITCPTRASAFEELTPQRVADLLLEQEVTWHRDAAG